ncbi:urea amidolyase [Sulfitobacter sp. HNIBRBA3233]|uniref:5-oxoprolinase subunit C family protein n=1 Tax=Sulfitobacter marinivivus TaxID=3158558 RepID=UPI0032DFAC16
MSRTVTLASAGPALSVQDMGRPGFLAQGLTRGGAMDTLALAEGAALLGQDPGLAAIELGGMGGTFTFGEDTRIALTGAPMPASCDGETLAWYASHLIPAGAKLVIGVAQTGNYGYLHVGGGIDVAERMGARATHLSAGLGALLAAGDELPVGPDKGTSTGMTLTPEARFDGGTVRIVASMQTDLFDAQTQDQFTATAFKRDARANRMGVRLDHDGPAIAAAGQLNILSDVIVQGDIQVTGDGAPFVLMADCQTTGGYPRIATVIPADLPRMAQAPAGATLRFSFVDMSEARAIQERDTAARAKLKSTLRPLLRDPSTIRDLLSYTLISGVVSATHDPYQ